MTRPEARVTPWNDPDRPTVERIRALVAAEGLSPTLWGNGPRFAYGWHTHATDKVLFCTSGGIVFHLDGGTSIAMGPGDRLDLPAGTSHSATVGSKGVRCVEAMRPRHK